MTMIEVLKIRIPVGMEIAKVSEKGSRYDLAFSVDGSIVKGTLPKTCAPGTAEKVADFTICTAMMALYLNRGDLVNARLWKDKQDELTGLKQLRRNNNERN